MSNKSCGYGLFDKELGLVYCSANGQYCDRKNCPLKGVSIK